MYGDLYLDVQGFVGNNNEFVPKEVALVWSEKKYHHFLIKPPYSFKELNYTQQKQNYWITSNTHKLFWEDGDVSFESVRQVIEEYLELQFVCVRGALKKKWIDETFPYTFDVINMEEKNLFSFKKLREKFSNTHNCYLHSNEACALQNAFLLYHNDKKE